MSFFPIMPLPQIPTPASPSPPQDELFEFIRGRRHSLDKRNKPLRAMRMLPPEGSRHSLEDLVWDTETLRILMQQMIERANASPMDVRVCTAARSSRLARLPHPGLQLLTHDY